MIVECDLLGGGKVRFKDDDGRTLIRFLTAQEFKLIRTVQAACSQIVDTCQLSGTTDLAAVAKEITEAEIGIK